MPPENDTIVAAATPPGTGGIAIVRISGEEALPIARAMLGSLPEPRVATFREFRGANGELLDAGLALCFPGSASFTGEPVVELHGHGGPVVVASLIEAIIGLGARRAEPGEFSKRAFLNDKIDLAQAEAIADLIGSGTEQASRAALRSLAGEFSTAVQALVEQLTALRTYVEAAIDFPEEELDFLADAEVTSRIEDCDRTFAALLDKAVVGRVLRDGFQVVIVGKPNAGKSSLMNRLSGEDTAIVTEVAGTTRDVLRERINLDGLAVELVDTAGLRDDPERVEAEGIRRQRPPWRAPTLCSGSRTEQRCANSSLTRRYPRTCPLLSFATRSIFVMRLPAPKTVIHRCCACRQRRETASGIGIAFLLASYRFDVTILGAFVAPLSLMLFLASGLGSSYAPVSPRVESAMLTLHIVANILGLVAFAIAFVAGIAYMLQESLLRRRQLTGAFQRLPSLGVLDTIGLRSVLTGFPLLTFGMVTGTFWLVRSGGSQFYVSQALGLVAWSIFAAVIVLRVAAGWQGRKAAVGTMMGFVFTLLVLVGYAVRAAGGSA